MLYIKYTHTLVHVCICDPFLRNDLCTSLKAFWGGHLTFMSVHTRTLIMIRASENGHNKSLKIHTVVGVMSDLCFFCLRQKALFFSKPYTILYSLWDFLLHVAVSLKYSGGIFNLNAFHLLLSLFA